MKQTKKKEIRLENKIHFTLKVNLPRLMTPEKGIPIPLIKRKIDTVAEMLDELDGKPELQDYLRQFLAQSVEILAAQLEQYKQESKLISADEYRRCQREMQEAETALTAIAMDYWGGNYDIEQSVNALRYEVSRRIYEI